MFKKHIKFNGISEYLLWSLIFISVVLAINSLVKSTNFIDKNFPGFLLLSNKMVSQTILKEWLEDNRSNIEFFDKVIEVDGKSIDNSTEIYSYLENKTPGTEVVYKLERDKETLLLSLPVKKFTFNNYLNIFGLQFGVGIIILLTGVMVFYLRPALISSKILLLLCVSLGNWFINDFCYLTNYSPVYYFNFAYFFQIFTPAFFVLMSFYFPEPKKFIDSNRWVNIVPVVFSFSLFTLQQVYRGSPAIWEQIDTIVWISLALGALYFVASLIWSYVRTDSHLYKQKAYVAIIGSFLGFLSPAILAVFFVIFGYDNISVLTIPVLFFPLSLGFSIVKHKLFDIDLIVQRTALYGATTAILAGCFIGLVYGLNSVVSDQISWQNPVLVILFCGLMVVALNPLRDKLQSVVDKMFFRNKYDYRAVVSGVSQELTTILNVDLIASTVVNSINRSMVLEHCELIVLNKKTGNYDSYSPGIDDEKPSIPIRSFLLEKNRIIAFLEQDTREIFKEDLFSETVFIGKKDQLLKEFDELNASLIIPVAINESMLGFLSLGNKRSGQPYNSIDLSLLKTLANQAAIAIENSYALKLVESYSDELERKNLHLKDVQSQLVHAEKMSSIGHLASGIAHEIRNPLNIIEGARYYLSNHLESSTSNDAVAKEYLEYIANEIQRTNKLIDELLLFSKPTDSDISQVNFNKLVDNILILTRKQVNDHSVRIEKVFDPNLPDVYVDSNQIWQVFVNLLINSLESMDKNGLLVIKTGVNHSIDNLNRKSDYAYIIFQDNGHGIKDECLEKIFDPFFTTKASGTGLGLAVGYKIIDSHSGRMLVNSEVGKGTRFMVEIPIESNNIN